MRPISFIFSAFVLFSTAIACSQPVGKTTAKDSATTSTAVITFPAAGEMPILEKLGDIKKVTNSHGSDLLVLNFWATFCGPCVAEMPYFVEISKKYPEKRVRVVGFSADLKAQRETVAIPFLKDKKIPYANFLLYPDDQEEMIKLFGGKWDGALPVTFFYDKSGKQISDALDPFESQEQLDKKIEELLKQVDAKK